MPTLRDAVMDCNGIKKKDKSIIELGLLYAQQAAVSGFPIVSFLIISYRFGPSVLGEFSQVLAFAYLAQPILVYSFDVNYFQVVNKSNIGVLSLSALLYRLAIAACACFFMLLIAPKLNLIPIAAAPAAGILTLELASISFQQIWLHNAISMNKEPTIMLVFARLISTFLFFTVPLETTYLILLRLAVAWTVPSLTASVMLYFHTKSKLKLRIRSLPKHILREQLFNELKMGSSLFAMNTQVFLIKDTSPMALGFLGVDSSLIGMYSLAEKVTQGFVTLSRPYRILLSRRLSNQLSTSSQHRIFGSNETIGKFFRHLLLTGLIFGLVSYLALQLTLCQSILGCFSWLSLIFSASLVFSIANGFWCGPPSKLFSSQSYFFFFSTASSLVDLIIVGLQFMQLINVGVVSLAMGYLLSEMTLFAFIYCYLGRDVLRLT